jgi:isopenicillin N synthase-like dioxygenase
MPDPPIQRISLGFHAAPPIDMRVKPPAFDALKQALPKGEWHDIETEDGTVTVNLSQVIYLRTDATEHRVGFGIAP